MNETIRMQISAYVDGELPESETELLLRRLSQDPALRAEVAEFTEIGRGMRGEYSVPGIHSLRQRVAAAIDADPTSEIEPEEPAARRSFIKPLSGVAVAAAVALVALVGLQQAPNPGVQPEAIADGSQNVATEYVVPDPDITEFVRMHGESTSAQGANGMNVRIVSFPIADGAPAEAVPAEDLPAEDSETEGESPDETPAKGTNAETIGQ